MPRPKKDSIPLNINLDREIRERLDAYCEEKGQSLTTAVERILKAHLDDHDKNGNG